MAAVSWIGLLVVGSEKFHCHQPADHWAGLRPGSRDGLPLLGCTRPGVVVATGHFRNGILLAPATAELVVQLVEGTGSAPAAFDPRRFRPPT